MAIPCCSFGGHEWYAHHQNWLVRRTCVLFFFLLWTFWASRKKAFHHRLSKKLGAKKLGFGKWFIGRGGSACSEEIEYTVDWWTDWVSKTVLSAFYPWNPWWSEAPRKTKKRKKILQAGEGRLPGCLGQSQSCPSHVNNDTCLGSHCICSFDWVWNPYASIPGQQGRMVWTTVRPLALIWKRHYHRWWPVRGAASIFFPSVGCCKCSQMDDPHCQAHVWGKPKPEEVQDSSSPHAGWKILKPVSNVLALKWGMGHNRDGVLPHMGHSAKLWRVPSFRGFAGHPSDEPY